jgi:hypothetical protein
MSKESIFVHQQKQIRQEFECVQAQETRLREELLQIDDEIIFNKSHLSLIEVQNNKLKSNYINIEKKNNRLDHLVHKLQAEVLQIVGSSDLSEQQDEDHRQNSLKTSFEDIPFSNIRRKCRSYHGSPEKLKWDQENEEALKKAKIGLEIELRKLENEHEKLIEMEGFLKKKSQMAFEQGSGQ